MDTGPERRAVDPAYLAALDGIRDELAGLRADVREDVRDVRTELRASIEGFALMHGREHIAEAAHLDELVAERDRVHADFAAFMRAAQLAQARRDGALGALRFVVELAGVHYRELGVLLGIALFGLAAIAGAIRIDIGVR